MNFILKELISYIKSDSKISLTSPPFMYFLKKHLIPNLTKLKTIDWLDQITWFELQPFLLLLQCQFHVGISGCNDLFSSLQADSFLRSHFNFHPYKYFNLKIRIFFFLLTICFAKPNRLEKGEGKKMFLNLIIPPWFIWKRFLVFIYAFSIIRFTDFLKTNPIFRTGPYIAIFYKSLPIL